MSDCSFTLDIFQLDLIVMNCLSLSGIIVLLRALYHRTHQAASQLYLPLDEESPKSLQ